MPNTFEILLKVGGKYVGWNSFKGEYYLTNLESAEEFVENPFNINKRLEKALSLFPNAIKVDNKFRYDKE